MTEAHQYALDVVSGKQVAGSLIIKAAQRFIRDLDRKDVYFDEEEGNKPIVFTERYLCQWEDKWRGKPIILEPWQKFIVQQLFGWFWTETKLRRFKSAYIQIAKKNGKTTLGAIIALYHLFADTRIQTPKVFVGANNEDQAKICVNCAGKIIEQSPELYSLVDDGTVDLFQYKENVVNIVHRERDGFIKAMSKEPAKTDTAQAGGKHGVNPSAVIVDEYALAESDALLNAMESAQGSRDEPLLVVITTSSPKQNGPCFMKLRKGGIDVLEGVLEDDTFLVIIYELDRNPNDPSKDDDINDPNVWMKANPNLGVSVSVDFLKTRLKKAKLEGGTKEVDVKTFNFNMWVDSPEVWIQSEVWNINAHGFSQDDLLGQRCYGGLEILQGLDLHCFSLLFPMGDYHAILPFFWMAAGRVRENKMKMDCSRWVKEGFIKTCPGDAIDNVEIFTHLLEKISLYNLHSLACSVKLETHDILQGLARNGVEWNPISMGYQGQSTPTSMWEELLTGDKVEHFNNPVLTWMNSNCMVIRSKDMDMKVQRVNGRTSGIIASIYALAQYKTVEANPDPEIGVATVEL